MMATITMVRMAVGTAMATTIKSFSFSPSEEEGSGLPLLLQVGEGSGQEGVDSMAK